MYHQKRLLKPVFVRPRIKLTITPSSLAIEDTTTLSYKHRSIRDDLGHVNQGHRYRGLLAHSVLLFASETHDVVGLIEQQKWTKDIQTRGIRRQVSNDLMKKKKVTSGKGIT